MVPVGGRRPRRAPAVAERQVRPRTCSSRSCARDPATDHRRVRHRSTASSPSAAFRSTGWPSGSAPPRSSPMTARCSPSGSSCCGRRLPRADQSELRGEGQSDAGGGAAPRRPGRRFRRRLGARDAASPWTRRCRRPDQLRRPRQDRGEIAQAVAAGRHHRDGVGDRGRARGGTPASGLGFARGSQSGSIPTSRSRARACAWAAGRSSSASTPRRCRPCSPISRQRTSSFSGSMSSPGPRT